MPDTPPTSAALPVCNHNGDKGACPKCWAYICGDCLTLHDCPRSPCWVSGYSDDLIEIDGVIREEFEPLDNGGEDMLLAFSTGVVLRIGYSKQGVWRIRPVIGASRVDITVAPEDDENNYSDVARLREPPSWVVLGTEIAKAP